MAPQPIDYSVVVPTLGGRATLSRCLGCVAAQTRLPAEVIVVAVEGASVDIPAGVRLLYRPASTSGQRNAGARLASTPVVLFVDDDVLLDPDFGEAMLAVWERAGIENVAGVVGTIPKAWELRLSRRILRAALGQSHVALLRRRRTRLMAGGNIAFVAAPREDEDVEFAGTACVSYRRDLVLEGPFDEPVGGYVLGEDLDMSARAARRGRLIHTPRARARLEKVTRGLRDDASGALQRGRLYAFYRGRYCAPGVIGRLAWEWANFGELAILVAKSMRRRDPKIAGAYLAGLHEARARLSAESVTGEWR